MSLALVALTLPCIKPGTKVIKNGILCKVFGKVFWNAICIFMKRTSYNQSYKLKPQEVMNKKCKQSKAINNKKVLHFTGQTIYKVKFEQ